MYNFFGDLIAESGLDCKSCDASSCSMSSDMFSFDDPILDLDPTINIIDTHPDAVREDTEYSDYTVNDEELSADVEDYMSGGDAQKLTLTDAVLDDADDEIMESIIDDEDDDEVESSSGEDVDDDIDDSEDF